MPKINKVNFDGAYLRSPSGHFYLGNKKVSIFVIRMTIVGGVMGWLYQGNGGGLGSSFEGPLGTSKAHHVSKFVEFYKSVSFHLHLKPLDLFL